MARKLIKKEDPKDSFLKSARIYLRGLQEKDLNGNWYAWLNDEIVAKYQNKGIYPNTREKQKKYFDYLQGSSNDVVLAIIHQKTHRHIGNVGLHEIDWVHRTATLGILIGEKDFWNEGYGTEAWKMITDYGFGKLNLNRITAYIISRNKGSLKVALKNRFRKEGVLRSFYYKNSSYYDLVVTGILKTDWLRS